MDQQFVGNGQAVGGAFPVPHHRAHAHSMHHDQAAAAMALAEAERADEAARGALKSRRELVYFFGRIFIGLLFLATAVAKVVRFDGTVEALSDSGMYDAPWLLPAAIAVEAIGGLALLAGYQVRRVAVALAVYLIGVTFLVSFEDLANSVNANSALSNLGFVGALLMLAGHGSGKYSVDGAIEHRAALRDAAA